MSKKNKKSLGEKVKDLREEKKWYQVDLAIRVGVSTSYISAIEQGTRYPSLRVLEKISKALKTSASELLKK